MTAEELDVIVESKLKARLTARLAADRDAIRQEIIREIVREQDRAWYDRVNRKHPIETAGDPRLEAKRRADMAARAKADNEAMDRVNARPIEGGLVHQRSRASLTPGSEGFHIKGPGGR